MPQVILLAFLILSAMLVSIPRVHSGSRPVVNSRWTFVRPAIDGVFSAADPWLTGSPLALLPPDYPVKAFVYFLNDKTNLYIMVDAVGDWTDGSNDESLLYFNSTHPYKFSLIGDSTHITKSTGSCPPYSCPPFEGSIGFGRSPLNSTSHKIYEFSISLGNIGFVPGHYSIDISSPSWKGPSIVYDADTGRDNVWPSGLSFSDVNTWGILSIAPPQVCLQSGSTGYWTCQVPLGLGWNLISLPIVPNATANVNSVDLLFNQTGLSLVTSVFTYTVVKGVGSWQFCTPKLAVAKWSCIGTLKFMVDGAGYWVLTKGPGVVLKFVGSVIPPASGPPSYALQAGWNLVGYKPQPNASEPKSVGTYLSSIAGKYDPNNVWVYDNTIGNWIRASQDGSTWLKPGQAMWVLMTAPAILRP